MTTTLIDRALLTTASQTIFPSSESAQGKTIRPFRFLIVGYTPYQHTENSIGPWVAKTIATWQVPTVKSIAVPQLTPVLVNEITAADYVIFVAAHLQHNHCRTVRVTPLVAGQQNLSDLASDTNSCNPYTLLNLAQHLYGNVPLTWLIQVPRETAAEKEASRSKIAQYGDRALQTIEQFLRTYL